MKNNRKTIGVFISQISSEYQTILCKGLISKAKELDYNILFFTSFGGYGQTRYDIGEGAIANLPYYEDFDGIIIATDTLVIDNLEDIVDRNIKKYANCPVVSIRRKKEQYYNIIVDDRIVISEIVNHFVMDHKYKKINFLSGPKGFPDSEKRLQCFLEIMKEHNLEVKESQIFYGDLWRSAGYVAVEEFLKDENERPEAIICANDYMAITVCNALMEHGIRVPEDIAVSGCDDIDDASEYSPSITTARTPVFEMGEEAVSKLHRIIKGENEPNTTFVNSKTVFRESCGCKVENNNNRKEIRRKHIEVMDQLKNYNSANAYMSTDFTGEIDFDQVINKIDIYIFENKGFQNFFLCLCDDWDGKDEENDIHSGFSEYVNVKLSRTFTDNHSESRLKRRDLIPEEFIKDEPVVFFFAPLHHLEKVFGYVAINFSDNRAYTSIFQGWLINISNAFENLRMHSEVSRLVAELEEMYIRDALTGLYNRRGLELLSTKLLNKCITEKKSLLVVCADMDDLKVINDKYGHSYGDIAIKSIGKAFLKNIRSDDICTRCGGDEFAVIGIDYSEKDAQEFISEVQCCIDQYLLDMHLNFKVNLSFGYYIVEANNSTSIEECMNVADSFMYQEKYRRKALSYQTVR